MSDKKPPTLIEYKTWLANEHMCEVERTRPYYESVTSKVQRDLENSELWQRLTRELKEFDDQYLVQTGFPLQMADQACEILIKPFESFILKTYKKNILQNKRWPKEPEGGWILPDNWFSRINDIIRTLIVVKYLDGVQFLVDKLERFCVEKNIVSRNYFEAREDGYYAGHLYVRHTLEIPKMTWDTELIEVSIEIQITTQLQETIRRLLHKYYEQKRGRVAKDTTAWQWNYKSDEFAANYLGHILHYVEGMIMEIREKQKRGPT